MKNPFKLLWIVLGFVCLGLGTVGVVFPVLPTVPFYMSTLFCFAKSSQKLHDWFQGTGLYQKHLRNTSSAQVPYGNDFRLHFRQDRILAISGFFREVYSQGPARLK